MLISLRAASAGSAATIMPDLRDLCSEHGIRRQATSASGVDRESR